MITKTLLTNMMAIALTFLVCSISHAEISTSIQSTDELKTGEIVNNVANKTGEFDTSLATIIRYNGDDSYVVQLEEGDIGAH